MPSTIMSCKKRHSCFIASHNALACSRSPASSASIARSIVGRDISPSSSSENQRSAISPPLVVGQGHILPDLDPGRAGGDS